MLKLFFLNEINGTLKVIEKSRLQNFHRDLITEIARIETWFRILSHCALVHHKQTRRCFSNPTNVGIARDIFSVATLVVVSDGVNIWVALRLLYH